MTGTVFFDHKAYVKTKRVNVSRDIYRLCNDLKRKTLRRLKTFDTTINVTFKDSKAEPKGVLRGYPPTSFFSFF